MALKIAGVMDHGMHAEEALSGSSRFEPRHLALSSPYRLMRVLRPLVAPKPLFIQPDGVLDDLGREAMAAIAERGHADFLPDTCWLPARFP
jgi:hypothetical protein